MHRIKTFNLPQRGQIQYSKVENFLHQIAEYNFQLRVILNDNTAFRLIKIKIIYLSINDNHKIRVDKTIYASIIESLNKDIFKEILENDKYLIANT